MELSFADIPIRDICENENIANNQLGNAIAKKLQNRLSDMIAARFVYELIVGTPSEINDDGQHHYKVDLCDGYRLVFSSNHIKQPLDENNNINWLKVSHIKILKIEPYGEI